MADTGFNWGSWAAMQKGSSDWTADALASGATETGDATSLDGKAACIVGIKIDGSAAGAVDGVITVYVLGDVDGTNYEETTIGSPWSFTVTPVSGDIVYKSFAIDPKYYDNFKIALYNSDGSESFTMTVKYKTATIPVAS